MILLDTNYLIGALVVGSGVSNKILSWLERGEVLLTAMPAWYEFLCGPVSAVQIAAVRAILSTIVPLEEIHAQRLLCSSIGRVGNATCAWTL